MEKFKENLKIQSVVLAVSGLALIIVTVLKLTGVIEPILAANPASENWREFISGVCAGVLLMMVVSLVRNVLALRSEKALKKMYIKENDERQIKIFTSARASAFQAFITLGIAGFIIAGTYSVTVGLTILGCLLVCTLLTAGFKLYYGKKY